MAASVLLTAALALTLFLSGFLSMMASLPFAFTWARRGPRAALMATGIAGASLLALYLYVPLPILPFRTPTPAFGIIYFLYYAWIGLALAHLGRPGPGDGKTISLEKGVLGISASALVLALVAVWVVSLLIGIDPILEARTGIQRMFEQMVALNEQSGLQGEELRFLRESIPTLSVVTFSLLPGIAVAATFLTVTFNLSVLRRWKGDQLFQGAPEFAVWRLPEWGIWVPIVGGCLYFANAYFLKMAGLRMVLHNSFIVLGTLYLYQGLAIVSWFLRRRFSPWARMASYLVILLFFQMVGVMIILLGLFDFWFDFRKLKKIQ